MRTLRNKDTGTVLTTEITAHSENYWYLPDLGGLPKETWVEVAPTLEPKRYIKGYHRLLGYFVGFTDEDGYLHTIMTYEGGVPYIRVKAEYIEEWEYIS